MAVFHHHGTGCGLPIYKLTFLAETPRRSTKAWRVSTAFWRKSPFPNRNTPKCRSRMRWSSATCHSPTKIRNRAHVPRRCAMFASRRRKAGLRRSWGLRGSGKSTVANLIPRFWDVEQGEILIGGVNIKNIATTQLMDTVSFVFQDTFLFLRHAVREHRRRFPRRNERNGRGGVQSRPVPRVHRAAAARLRDDKGDEGVFVGRRGAAGMRGPRHSEECADTGTGRSHGLRRSGEQYKMQQALQSLIKGKTVIIIAHRLSSIVSADNIVVLQQQERTAGPARLIRRRGALQEHVGCLYERLSLEVEQKLNTEI